MFIVVGLSTVTQLYLIDNDNIRYIALISYINEQIKFGNITLW